MSSICQNVTPRCVAAHCPHRKAHEPSEISDLKDDIKLCNHQAQCFADNENPIVTKCVPVTPGLLRQADQAEQEAKRAQAKNKKEREAAAAKKAEKDRLAKQARLKGNKEH